MLKNLQKSYYGESFKFRSTEYQDIDYSKLSLILPGQGSLDLQQVASEIRHIPSCTEFFKRADEWAFQEKLPKISGIPYMQFTSIGDEFLLKNLYLFTMTVALCDYMKQSGRSIEVLTSHSFGECAVLVCSGMLSFEDGLSIVKWREEVSPPPASKGTLLALSCSLDQIADVLLLPEVYLANVNSKQQIVLAVAMDSLPKVKAHLKKSKIAAVELKTVARPYHSNLMLEAGDRLKDKILQSQINVGPVEISFISSADQKMYSKGVQLNLADIAELMKSQLTKPVYFDQQIQKIKDQNIYSFLELGFSEIYIGFIQNILSDKNISAQSMRWLCKKTEDKVGNKAWAFDVQNSPFLGVLRKYINKVTGYDVLDIQIHDQFQEDLRIDSIKKAEIVFKTLEELNLSIDESLRLAQLRSVGDIVDFLEGLKKKPIKAKNNKKVTFDIYKNHWTPLPSVNSSFEKNSLFKTVDIFDTKFAETLNDVLNQQDLDYCLLSISRNFVNSAEKLEFIKALRHVFKSFSDQGSNLCLGLVSNTKFHKDFDELAAFLKSLCKELKLKFRSCLHKDSFKEELFLNYIQVNPFVVEYLAQDNKWFAKSYEQMIRSETSSVQTNSSLTVMVIGGHRGLAYELLLKNVFAKNTKIILVGRSAIDDAKVSKNLLKIQKRYQDLIYCAGDARSVEFMSSLLANHKVDIVINSAGLEFSRLLSEKTDQEIDLEYNTKIEILDVIESLRNQYGFNVINFSSVAAAFGNGGQTVYSMASAYQAHHSEHLNIYWPPLERVGMTENLGILMKLKESGLGLLPLEQAVSLFKQLVSEGNQGAYLLLSPQDLFLYEVELCLDLPLFKALGYLVDPKNATFMKIFNKETDRYVLDHVIEQMPVIPASYQLASMMLLASGYFKNLPDLHNFNIKNIMLMMEGEDLKSFTHLDIKSSRSIKSTVFTQMEHFSADLSVNKTLTDIGRKPEPFDLDLICDKFYSPECVGFGPKMQVLKVAHFNTKNENIIGFARSEKFYLTGSSVVDLWMASFEVAFQVMALKGIMIGKGLCIPLSLDSIEVIRVPNGEIRFQVELHEVYKENDAFPMKGTISAYDDQNRICFKMNNVMMSKIRHFETIPFDSVPKEILI